MGGEGAGYSGGMGVVIRDAVVADLPAIFEIYNEQVMHGTATFDTEPRVLPRDEAWLTARDVSRHPVIVAVDGAGAATDGEVVGWASLSQWSPRRAYDRTAEESVYVRADKRGQGLGGLLLREIVARARRPGSPVRVLVARIADSNPVSIRLHEAAGFTRIGTQRRCGEKFGRVLDVELMDLHLDA